MNASDRRAVIDIGTNSVKVLVADVAGGQLEPISEMSSQTRLGAGFYATHQLQPAAIQATAAAVEEFRAAAIKLGASAVRVIATSAARDAVNAADLLEAVRAASGLKVEILSGAEEAESVFRGVTSQPRLAQTPALILDVGGGSTEFILGYGGTAHFSHSYNQGTVRLLEQLHLNDPPGLPALAACRETLRQFLLTEVAPQLQPALRACPAPPLLIGTSGTATILARVELGLTEFDRARMETVQISLEALRQRLEEFWQMPQSRRQQVPGIPPKREDVILTGAAIYEAIMEIFSFPNLGVSTRGLRDWTLLRPQPLPPT